LIWFAPSNYELWVFFTLTLGDSYFPFLAYSCFPITLGMTKSVNSRGIYPVYAKFNSTLNRMYGFTVVLCAPTIRPIATPYCPTTKSDRGNMHICISKLTRLHNEG
jgi:hypothetical protein